MEKKIWFDVVIIGAGLYGLYSALKIAENEKDCRILLVDAEKHPLSRATYANQARVHMGYHYPRSISTAKKSRGYFQRFVEDYGFCINKKFEQIYAISENFSWTDSVQFEKFCENAGIPYRAIDSEDFFKEGVVSGAYLVQEYTYDAIVLRDYFITRLKRFPSVEVITDCPVTGICRVSGEWNVRLLNTCVYRTKCILNTTYASSNLVNRMAGLELFRVKYELCEIILCDTRQSRLAGLGFTVMDGPFFSIMPFGNTGYHSLTSVTFTPHESCLNAFPSFSCQHKEGALCSSGYLGNCNLCPCKPLSAWAYMSKLAHKYLKNEYSFEFRQSLFAVKPILLDAEIDDSRPTVIRIFSKEPVFISVLSGKVNTIFDLDEVLEFDFNT